MKTQPSDGTSLHSGHALTSRRLCALDACELGAEAVGEAGDLRAAADGCDGEARRQLRLRRRLPTNTGTHASAKALALSLRPVTLVLIELQRQHVAG